MLRLPAAFYAVVVIGGLAVALWQWAPFATTERTYFDISAGRMKHELRFAGICYRKEITETKTTHYYRTLIGDDLPEPIWLLYEGATRDGVPQIGGPGMTASTVLSGLTWVLDGEDLTEQVQVKMLRETLRALSLSALDGMGTGCLAGRYQDGVSTVVAICRRLGIKVEPELIPSVEDAVDVQPGRAYRWAPLWLEEKTGLAIEEMWHDSWFSAVSGR